MMIISILLTILIAGIIGWQAKMKQFPFNGFKWDNSGFMGGANCILTIYNIYVILTTWLSLGILTIQAIIYLLIVIGAFALGWNYTWVNGFIWDCKHVGLLAAVRSAWQSLISMLKNNKH